ncbi:hypothetical protein Tco_1497459, partial [Tanacetum coccineum]
MTTLTLLMCLKSHSSSIKTPSCGKGAHHGYNCPSKVPIIFNPEPCNNQTVDELPQTLPSFDPICDSGEGNLLPYVSKPNLVDDSPNPPPQPPTFDQFQPSQFIIDHIDSMNDHLKAHRDFQQPSQCRKIPICDDDDDDEYSFATQEYLKKFSSAITPDLPKSDSLIMEDKHLNTIPETESEELIKSSVEDLVHTPSESDGISESECDVPDCDDSQTTNFSTFSNPLFDDSTSSDDESSHEEVIHEISFKTYSNPLFDLDEEIISSEFNPIHNEDLDFTLKNDRFDTESYLLESLLNRDTLMASSPKIDSLLDEFAGELITIPLRIFNREDEEYISLLERLLYDNSSPCPPEDFHTIIESLPTFPIPVEDSDSLREEIDIFPGPDDSIPPGIESDDYDSEGDDNST